MKYDGMQRWYPPCITLFRKILLNQNLGNARERLCDINFVVFLEELVTEVGLQESLRPPCCSQTDGAFCRI